MLLSRPLPVELVSVSAKRPEVAGQPTARFRPRHWVLVCLYPWPHWSEDGMCSLRGVPLRRIELLPHCAFRRLRPWYIRGWLRLTPWGKKKKIPPKPHPNATLDHYDPWTPLLRGRRHEPKALKSADPAGPSAVRTSRTYGILDPKDLVGVPQNPSLLLLPPLSAPLLLSRRVASGARVCRWGRGK